MAKSEIGQKVPISVIQVKPFPQLQYGDKLKSEPPPVAIQLFETCFDIGFYCCCVPYRFVKSSTTGYYAVTNCFQKVVYRVLVSYY